MKDTLESKDRMEEIVLLTGMTKHNARTWMIFILCNKRAMKNIANLPHVVSLFVHYFYLRKSIL